MNETSNSRQNLLLKKKKKNKGISFIYPTITIRFAPGKIKLIFLKVSFSISSF